MSEHRSSLLNLEPRTQRRKKTLPETNCEIVSNSFIIKSTDQSNTLNRGNLKFGQGMEADYVGICPFVLQLSPLVGAGYKGIINWYLDSTHSNESPLPFLLQHSPLTWEHSHLLSLGRSNILFIRCKLHRSIQRWIYIYIYTFSPCLYPPRLPWTCN